MRPKAGLEKAFTTAVASGQAAIRINTDEMSEALDLIAKAAFEHHWKLNVFDQTRGLRLMNQAKGAAKGVAPKPRSSSTESLNQNAAPGALAALLAFLAEKPITSGTPGEPAIQLLVIKNFHVAIAAESTRGSMSSAVQCISNDLLRNHFDSEEEAEAAQLDANLDSVTGKCLIVIQPAETHLPPEIEPLFQVIDHELPDEQELHQVLRSVLNREITDATRREVVKASLGLTRLQAESIFAAAQAVDDEGGISAPYVWEQKAKILNREGLVEIHKSEVTFADIGGQEGKKDFLRRLLAADNLDDVDPDVRYRGILDNGPPGTGKSLMAYAVGNEFHMPTIKVNPGNLMGEFVGTTERNTRKVFQVLRRSAPVVCVIDEVDKVMPSGDEGGKGSDVGRRMLGNFLTQMQDITEPVFWYFTANSAEGLHDAFGRAERVDAKFVTRLPDKTQRPIIWRIYLKKFFPAKVNKVPDGRHIILDVHEAADVFFRDKKTDMRDWASRIAAALMAMPPAERDDEIEWLGTLGQKGEELALEVQTNLIDDDKWTPAEIRACCRLMRRLKMTLGATAKRIGHVCHGNRGEKMLTKISRWALSEGALDSETGELYTAETPQADAPAGSVSGGTRVKRKVRNLEKRNEQP